MMDVTLEARVRAEHDWVALDGRAWVFRLVEVRCVEYRSPGLRVAVVVNEDDLPEAS